MMMMMKQEIRGKLYLTSPEAKQPKVRFVTRIYYLSEGGEILCCDSDPLTPRAARSLADSLKKSIYDVLFVEAFCAESKPPPRQGSRLVTLPHQAHANIDIKTLRQTSDQAPRVESWGKPPVCSSPDLVRVLSLDRRPKPSELTAEALIEIASDRHSLGLRACACRTIDPKRPCIVRLRTTQAWALYEIARCAGLLGPINVGDGKSLLDILAPMAMPECKTALLMVPAKLVDQLVLEYRMVREHWRVPSLLVHGKDYAPSLVQGVPALHLISYERLSRPDATTFLERLNPDTIIADECDALKDPSAVRTGRLLRFFAAKPDTRFCGWSGSMTDASIRDYAHISVLALKMSSPLPVDPNVVEDWARAIDPSDFPAPPGALLKLCDGPEDLYQGFHRRLTESYGVVTSTKPQVTAELRIEERKAPVMPTAVEEALATLREEMVRPDGEELIDALSFFRCARELACGFFYRWVFRHGETVEQIDAWLAARKAYRREVREMLKDPKPHLDSPALLFNAAARADKRPDIKKTLYFERVDGELLPHWRSMHWRRWIEAKPLVNRGKTPDTEPVRLDSYLAEDAAAWGLENRGIIWYDSTAFGQWVAELSGLPMHGGGPDAGPRIGAERGDRSIVASIPSHGRGRDGLQFLFDDQLVAHPPASATMWEQMLGRLHRSGQRSPVVRAQFYAHTEELKKQVQQALRRSAYVAGTIGNEQKLRAGWSEKK